MKQPARRCRLDPTPSPPSLVPLDAALDWHWLLAVPAQLLTCLAVPMLSSADLLAVGISLLHLVDAEVYTTRFPTTTWDDTHWRICTAHLDQGHYQSRMSLSNGYLGINLAALGPFFEVDTVVNGDVVNGWPLFDHRQTFATIAGFYDSQPTTNASNFEWLNQYGGESVISGVPHWAGLHVKCGHDILTASTPAEQIRGFKSELDVKAATLRWEYVWTPPSMGGGRGIGIEYEMFVHKLHINRAAVQLRMTADEDIEVDVIDVLNGDCALRSTAPSTGYEPHRPVIWSAVRPHGIDNVTAYVYSALNGDRSCEMSSRSRFADESVIGANASSIAQQVTAQLKAGRQSTITKYIGAASTDAFDDPQAIAFLAYKEAMREGYAGLLASHAKEWRTVMPTDSVDSYRFPSNGSLPHDPNILELQITAITNPFHLLQNTLSANAVAAANNTRPLDVYSIPVGGLGSDSYAGFIFWDAEVWMAPGLVVAFPEAAKQIALHRVEKFPQAQRNVQTAYQSSQNRTGKFSPKGAVYSWTSGRFGNCTGTGPCFDYEYHINGDIGLELYNYYVATGDTEFFREQLFPVYDAIAQFYTDVVTFNETSGEYDLYNATDPDEYANFETNVGYTMVLMHTHINTANLLRSRLGYAQDSMWENVSSLINIPVDHSADIILEYAAMNGSIQVKQADVVLVDDFLDYPNPYSLNDLNYYAGKQSLNGPGMTYGVFSIIANELDASGCASYTYDLYGSQPYVRAPWFQFSEQLIDDFELNGGTHPAYPFLTGIGGANRVAVFGYLGLRLMLDSLNIDPNLPPQIPHLAFRTIYWQGWPVKAVSNQTHTTLTRLHTPLAGANQTFARHPIPVTVGIANSTSLGTSNATVHRLYPHGTLTLPNRQTGRNKATPGNIAQCQPALSPQAYTTGQFPLSAVDGAVSTKWQPATASDRSALVVSLDLPSRPIGELRFDWAQDPPEKWEVWFTNSSTAPTHLPSLLLPLLSRSSHTSRCCEMFETSGPSALFDQPLLHPHRNTDDDNDATVGEPVLVAQDPDVQVSDPYDPARASEIVPYKGNTTNVTLAHPVWSGKWAVLVVQGSRAGNVGGSGSSGSGGSGGTSMGATVAEFEVVHAGSNA